MIVLHTFIAFYLVQTELAADEKPGFRIQVSQKGLNYGEWFDFDNLLNYTMGYDAIYCKIQKT